MEFTENLLSSTLLILILGTLRSCLPLILAALGGLLSERSGTIQIALEAQLLAGALGAAIVTYHSGSPLLGLLAGASAGLAVTALMGALVLWIRGDQIVVGAAINILIFGAAPLITKAFFGSTGSTPNLPIEQRFTWEPYLICFLVVSVIYYVLQFSRIGIFVKFAGSLPSALEAAGLSALRIRWVSLLACGLTTGMGGAFLSTFLASSYSPMMSAGRGFIALGALIFGRWRPLPTVLICLVFSFFESTANYLQGSDTWVPVALLQTLPYLLTILALTSFAAKAVAPLFLGRFSR